jgi:hypothetical protein
MGQGSPTSHLSVPIVRGVSCVLSSREGEIKNVKAVTQPGASAEALRG